MENALVKLWQFSLWFLFTVVALLCAPVSFFFTGPIMLLVGLARRRARIRHEQYSWSHHRPGRPRKSGYRRARYGMFA